jgi:rRNA processing protein Gar1
MDKLKNFLQEVDWKRMGKIALVIGPVLLWEVWYNAIKYTNILNEKINTVGDKFLSNFMNGK